MYDTDNSYTSWATKANTPERKAWKELADLPVKNVNEGK